MKKESKAEMKQRIAFYEQQIRLMKELLIKERERNYRLIDSLEDIAKQNDKKSG